MPVGKHDLTGRTFGRWTVLEKARSGFSGFLRWKAVCACGAPGSPGQSALLEGRSTQCRACGQKERGIKRRRDLDLVGQSFGGWTVTAFSHRTRSQPYWWCRCACGALKRVQQGSLTSGTSHRCASCAARKRWADRQPSASGEGKE